MSKILIVSGSPSSTSRTAAIASFIRDILVERDQEVVHLPVRDLPAQALSHAQFHHPEIKKAQKLVEEAEALIVVSPIYKASYPGILKSFFDLIPENGLSQKKVLPIASGGTIAHLLSLEFAFKPLFSILGARDILQGVYVVDSQCSYTGEKLAFTDPELKERLESAVHDLQTALNVKSITLK